MVAFSTQVVYNTFLISRQYCLISPGVAQLVGRLVWDQDAASSSLATRTKKEEEE